MDDKQTDQQRKKHIQINDLGNIDLGIISVNINTLGRTFLRKTVLNARSKHSMFLNLLSDVDNGPWKMFFKLKI